MYDSNKNDGFSQDYADHLNYQNTALFDTYPLSAFEQEYNLAVLTKADRWVPACGGKEIQFECQGRHFLYCYNPALHQHAYLDLDQDLILAGSLGHMLPDCLAH